MYQPSVKADCRVDVKFTRFGFKVAKHFKGLKDGSGFEKNPFKVRYGFSWRFFLEEVEKAYGIKDGVLQKGLLSAFSYGLLSLCALLYKHEANGLAQVLFSLAITLDGSVVSTDVSDTQSITVASNSNRVLLVTFGTYQGGAASGVTHAGNAMTKVKEQLGSFSEAAQMWGILAPTTGANNVVVSGASNYRGISIYSLYDCDQSLPTGGDAVAASGDSSTASVSITPSVDNCWIVDSLEMEAVPTMTTSSGVSDAVQEGASYQHVAASHFVQSTAAAKTMSYSGSYGSRWNICAVAVKPAGGAASGQPTVKRSAYVPGVSPMRRHLFGGRVS